VILLELTEKEVETIHEFMEVGWLNYPHSDRSHAERERLSSLCQSVASKLREALKPKEDALITSKDLFHLKDLAKSEYRKLPGSTQISNQNVEQKDLVHISLANAVISWLNGKNLLKKPVRFDYTDNSCQYEENE